MILSYHACCHSQCCRSPAAKQEESTLSNKSSYCFCDCYRGYCGYYSYIDRYQSHWYHHCNMQYSELSREFELCKKPQVRIVNRAADATKHNMFELSSLSNCYKTPHFGVVCYFIGSNAATSDHIPFAVVTGNTNVREFRLLGFRP